MTALYRTLGIVASICNKSSRTRVNGFPAHVWVLVMCVFLGGVAGAAQFRDSATYGKPPISYTAASILQKGAADQFVSVTGILDNAASLNVSHDHETETYVPMYDPVSKRAFLVVVQDQGNLEGVPVTITGMLRPMESDVSRSIDANNDYVGKYGVTTEFALRQGQSPTDPRWLFVTAAVAGLPALLIAASLLMKHVIFQSINSGPTRIASAGEVGIPVDRIPTRFSGRMTLSPKVSQRFLNMNAAVTRVTSGELALVSAINASISTQYGGLINRSGMWVAIVKPGTLRTLSKGLLYVGLSVKPALSLSYVDTAGPSEKSATSVLSFETEQDRDTMWNELQKPTPTFSPTASSPTAASQAAPPPFN